MIKPWNTESESITFSSAVFTLKTVQRTSQLSGNTGTFFTLNTADWVNVMAVTKNQKLVLVRQFRHGISDICLEIPGGMVDPGENPAQSAARELLEETGYQGDPPVEIGVVHPNPAIQSNRCYTFLITNAHQVSEPNPEENEEIEPALYSLSAVGDYIRQGKITHALVIAAFYWYMLYTGENGDSL
ncbi:MAG TPA: NUDIX hydrolase [Balneolales bacterium]|nr:NUDIX hydrolase [Balneolales bacterium]